MSDPLLQNKKLHDRLTEAVRSIKADYAEIRAEESASTRISFRGPDPELIAEPKSLGFFVRVLQNGSWGIATFSDLETLPEKIDQALSFARLQGRGSVVRAGSAPVQAEVNQVIKKDFREIPLREKVTLVKEYNDLLFQSAPGIQTSNIIYADTHQTKFFANSKGSRILQVRPSLRLSYMAVGREGDVIEAYRGSIGHVGGYEVVEGLSEKMLEVSKEAAALTRVPKVKSGTYTVILDPLMAGTFAHEAFGHLSEADHQYENPKLLEQMRIGRKLGSDKVTIIDDPQIPEGWGNYTYDDEGVEGKRVNLMTEGVITGRLHSLETAGKLGEKPNGHARADGFSNKPIIRMSNTFFAPGTDKLNDLISSTKKGILVVNWLGGMTAMESFTFTAMYGVMIEDGKLTTKVRGVKLQGNVFETLGNIDGVSPDFAHDQGTCGKEGQHMPVGSGGGYVRIQNVVVGGA